LAAAPKHYAVGMECNVFGDAVEMYKSRGLECDREECEADMAAGKLIFLGTAEILQWRAETFGSPQKGQALRMLRRVHQLPSLNGVLPELVTLHGLPSSLVAHALSPQRGENVLDMCSSPGGKAAHVATMMGNTGKL
jgi:hypothetical protein